MAASGGGAGAAGGNLHSICKQSFILFKADKTN